MGGDKGAAAAKKGRKKSEDSATNKKKKEPAKKKDKQPEIKVSINSDSSDDDSDSDLEELRKKMLKPGIGKSFSTSANKPKQTTVTAPKKEPVKKDPVKKQPVKQPTVAAKKTGSLNQIGAERLIIHKLSDAEIAKWSKNAKKRTL